MSVQMRANAKLTIKGKSREFVVGNSSPIIERVKLYYKEGKIEIQPNGFNYQLQNIIVNGNIVGTCEFNHLR